MREIRPSGSAGGAGQLNAPFLPRSTGRVAQPEGHLAGCVSYQAELVAWKGRGNADAA